MDNHTTMTKNTYRPRKRPYPLVIKGKIVRLNLIPLYERVSPQYYVDVEDLSLFTYSKSNFSGYGRELVWRMIDGETALARVRTIDGHQQEVCSTTLAGAIILSQPLGPDGPYNQNRGGH